MVATLTIPETAAAMADSKSTGKGGAQPQNNNRTTHGVRAWEVCGRLPRGMDDLKQELDQLQAGLTQLARDQNGSVSLYRAFVVYSTVRHFARALLYDRWLTRRRKHSLADKMALREKADGAIDLCVKNLKLLGLDAEPNDINSIIDAAIVAADRDACEARRKADEEAANRRNANGAIVGDLPESKRAAGC
jgi:hypothetical protein